MSKLNKNNVFILELWYNNIIKNMNNNNMNM